MFDGSRGGYGGGIYSEAGGTIVNSTISGNSVVPATSGRGAGIVVTNGITMTNVTISGNNGGSQGGGMWVNGSTNVLTNVTIADNTGTSGSGLYWGSSGTIALNNSIVWNNAIFGAVPGSNNLIGTNPSLGALANNGGLVRTRALLTGSVAIDAGSNALVPPGITTDARGTGYARINDGDGVGGATVDIGAFEAAPADVTPPDTTLMSTPPPVSSSTTATFVFSGSDVGTGVAGYQCALDAASFAACSTPVTLTALSEGSHTFKVRAVDGVSNIDPTPASYTWTVDSVAPDTSLTAAPASVTNSTTASFSFTGSDAGTGVASFTCSLDGGPFTACTSPTSASALSAGAHTFAVRALDNAGNIDPSPASFSWTIDVTAPDTTLTATPPAIAASSAATFSFTGSDGTAVQSFECSMDGGAFTTCTSPRTLNGLADGSHTFAVRAIDTAGNVDGTPATHTWTIDTAAPDTTLTATPAVATASTAATFAFSGSDGSGSGVASFTCSLDGSVSACSSPATFPLLASGAHTFSVVAIDAAGNADPTPASFTWTVDSNPPDTTITAGPASPTNSASALFVFAGNDASGSGVASFECALDAATFVACISPQAYSGLADGPHTVAVRATDLAGNVDPTPASYAWNIDTIAPDTSIASAPPAMSASASATFAFTGSDSNGTTTFECSLDASAFTPCPSTHTITGLADGSHTLDVRAVDGAANVDPTPASYTWMVDTTAPETTITSNPTSPSSSDVAMFTFTGTDANSVASFECSVDGAAYTGCYSPVTLSALSDGPHTFAVRAVDTAGNVDPTPASYAWTVDTTAPETTLDTKPAAYTSSTTAEFTFTGLDAAGTGVKGFQCDVDGAGFSGCASPLTLAAVTEGAHTIAIRAIDAIGNVDPTPASHSWTVDLTAPETTITSGPPANSNASTGTIVFAGTDLSGIDSFECSLDGAPFAACTTPVAYTALGDGNHVVAIRAIDLAGNVDATPASFSWSIDTVAPETTIVSTPAAQTASGSATFTFSATDNSGSLSFECSIDGSAFAACVSPHALSGLAGGAHTFCVRAVDPAGNTDATPASYTWSVGDQPAILSAPATTFTVGTGGAFTITVAGAPTPAITVTGPLPSGVTFVDNGDGTATLAGLPAFGTGGLWPIEIRASNGFGTDAVQAFTLTVQSIITFSGPTPTGTGTATASISGGGSGCTFVTAAFIAASSVPPLANAQFPHGLFEFVLRGCVGPMQVTVQYPTALPAGSIYWKYGPTAPAAAPSWYQFVPPVSTSTNTFTLTLADNALGDDDWAATTDIVDQGGPAVPAEPIPTASELALAFLAMAVATLGARLLRM